MTIFFSSRYFFQPYHEPFFLATYRLSSEIKLKKKKQDKWVIVIKI